jgi:M42 glutamyl aminopeptidase
MLFAHMDQLGFVVRKIEPTGFLRLERLGGVPERALASQEILICIGEGRDIPAVVGNKSHHATSPEEKYRVVPYQGSWSTLASQAPKPPCPQASRSALRLSMRREPSRLPTTRSPAPRSTIALAAL